MSKKSYWFPIDNESNWMLVGTIFGFFVMPILMIIASIGILYLLIQWLL